ncbi:putative nucleic acid-binding protein [Helianthus annuus]|nr:putative nucleic acid-binding protein [Helianthus annuus]
MSCVVVAMIKIVQENYGWFYPAYRNCNKKVLTKTEYLQYAKTISDEVMDLSPTSLVCLKCDKECTSITTKFKVHLRVQDETDLMKKLTSQIEGAVTLKYQLITEELDALPPPPNHYHPPVHHHPQQYPKPPLDPSPHKNSSPDHFMRMRSSGLADYYRHQTEQAPNPYARSSRSSGHMGYQRGSPYEEYYANNNRYDRESPPGSGSPLARSPLHNNYVSKWDSAGGR